MKELSIEQKAKRYDEAINIANSLAHNTNSELVQIVGNKITLFRQKKKDSKINLPK